MPNKLNDRPMWAAVNDTGYVCDVGYTRYGCINRLTGKEVGNPERNKQWRYFKKECGLRLVKVNIVPAGEEE